MSTPTATTSRAVPEAHRLDGLLAPSGPPRRAGALAASATFGWRAMLKIKHEPSQLTDVIAIPVVFTVLFTYIFAKGYEAKGIMEGARFGLIIGLFISIPMAYGTYVIIAIPYYLALQWFLYGTAISILLGVTAALVYKPAAAQAPGTRAATA